VIQFSVRVSPRSSKPGIAGVRNRALLVRLQSPPVDGAANQELVEVLARTFGAARRDVRIVSGEHSKLKRVEISTLERAHIESTLRSIGMDPTEMFP
jgi:uncharacterized protein